MESGFEHSCFWISCLESSKPDYRKMAPNAGRYSWWRSLFMRYQMTKFFCHNQKLFIVQVCAVLSMLTIPVNLMLISPAQSSEPSYRNKTVSQWMEALRNTEP